jgi:LPS-assembly protein
VNREIAAIERRAFDLDRPLINLGEQRSIDTFNPTHLLRIGIENRYQTRASGYGSRDLAALNFYQDVLLDKDDFERYDQEPASTFDASWVELMLRPAPWLKFDLSARLKTQGLTLEQLVTRTALISGESWQIGLSTDMLRRQIDQYRIDFITKLNERYALFSDIRFDSQANAFTHTRVGIHTKIGNIWEVIYALSFRNNTTRESDFGFTVSLRLNDL